MTNKFCILQSLAFMAFIISCKKEDDSKPFETQHSIASISPASGSEGQPHSENHYR